MMNLDRIIDVIDYIAPESIQESWDNSGIQISCGRYKRISKIMTCLEINEAVIDEAIGLEADLIVTHHPLIFTSVNNIDADDSIVGKNIIRLIKNDISVYAAHTSFDLAHRGTNYYLADKLGLKVLTTLAPHPDMNECGMGRYGEYAEAMSFERFLGILKAVCGPAEFRIAGKAPDSVKRVSVCTGSGADFIDEAFRLGSDVFVTGDLRYHDARRASDMGICVVDAGHYGTEVIFAENMAAQLQSKLGDALEIFASETDINPFL